MAAALNLRKIPSIFLLLFFSILLSAPAALGQSGSGAELSQSSQGVPLTTGDDQNVSAGQIIDILQKRPELISEAKKLIVEKLRQQGRAVPDDAISDEMLFGQIAQNPEFRKAVGEWLRNRGYMVQEDDELASGEQAMSGAGGENEYGDEVRSQSLQSDRMSTSEPRAAERTEQGGRQRMMDEGRPELTRRDRLTNREEPQLRRRERIETRPLPEADRSQGLVRRPVPYPNLPSLRDLYTQISDKNAKLKRFGSDLFRLGEMDSLNAPMDLPVGPDYVLGPGDGLNIDLWGGVSQRITRAVDREGRVVLPEAGPLVVAGMTLGQAQKAIQAALTPQFRDARVEVSVTRLRTVRVYVVGDVQRPGAYDVSSMSTPLNALYAAGGPTAAGSMRMVRHYRGKQLIKEVDLYDFMLHGIRSDVERLQPGDTILVPPVGPQITVAGMVRRPAIYELKGPSQLSDAIELAGGLLVSATLHEIRVERVEAHEKKVMLSVKVPDGGNQQEINNTLQSFAVQDGDRVTIAPILPYSEKTVYLEGHVFRPGKYSYHDGMTLSDLLHSYQDVLPEPANHAEIIRLQPPDYRPETIEFDLSEVLVGDDPINLQPFDTVRIFGRYEVDAPKVAIYGEVLRPGQYPLTVGMSAAALVRMAGGFKRSAFRDTADVTSYTVQDGKRVQTNHQLIKIQAALDGDASDDVKLKPGDVVTIRQLSGWKDVGASVTLNGEVVYPGTYGIQEGERLSSVLRRASGFRDSAYPAGAVLDRIEVQKVAEKARTELIQRIETAGMSLTPNASGQDQAAMMQAMLQQQQQVLTRLRNQPVTGRLVISISPDIDSWANTPADIELRPGDVLTIPKRPDFVLVSGQVYNSTAITYTPGKNAGWYLHRAGGPTDMANKKAIFVVRANGSVVSRHSGGWFTGDVLSTKLYPGDSIVVPEKIIGGSMFWKNLMTVAQFSSSIALTTAVALK